MNVTAEELKFERHCTNKRSGPRSKILVNVNASELLFERHRTNATHWAFVSDCYRLYLIHPNLSVPLTSMQYYFNAILLSCIIFLLGCVSGGVYVPCIYSHASESYCRRLGSVSTWVSDCLF